MRICKRFTPSSHDDINDFEIVKTYKYLGIYEDPGLTYKFHFEYLNNKSKNIIKNSYFM